MSGEALTNQFMLSTATIMLGAQADLMKLDKTNSVGLAKNFTINAQPSYTELTQGVKNNRVHSTMTGNDVTASMEVFEFTAKNIAYGLGQEGSGFAPATTATTANGVSNADQNTLTVASETGFSAGDWGKAGTGDDLVIFQVASVSAGSITTVDPLSAAVADTVAVEKMNIIGVGSKENQPFLAAKVTGQLADGEDVTLLIPKLRVIQGFAMAFSTENYGNLPYQFSMYELAASDPHYAQFKDLGQAAILKQT